MTKLEWDLIEADNGRQWWEAQVWEGFYKIYPRFGDDGDYDLTIRFQRDGIDEEDRVLGIVGALIEAKKIAQDDANKNHRLPSMYDQ